MKGGWGKLCGEVSESERILHFSHFNDGEVEMDMKISGVILVKWPYLFHYP